VRQGDSSHLEEMAMTWNTGLHEFEFTDGLHEFEVTDVRVWMWVRGYAVEAWHECMHVRTRSQYQQRRAVTGGGGPPHRVVHGRQSSHLRLCTCKTSWHGTGCDMSARSQ
jgi:hypothetical protein